VKQFSSGYIEVFMSGRHNWLACEPVCISSSFSLIYSVALSFITSLVSSPF